MNPEKTFDRNPKKSLVLFLVSSMEGGGAERVAALLSNHWVQHGRDVILMPTFSGRGECQYALDERVNLDYLADRVGDRKKTLFSGIKRLLVLRQVIREVKPDVIVSFLTNVNVAAAIASTGCGIRLVLCERTYPPALPLPKHMQWLRKKTYPGSSIVVMQTEQGRKWLNDLFGDITSAVIPNPAIYPLPVSQPIVPPEQKIDVTRSFIISVGRLTEEKGFDQLVAAFSAVAEEFPNWDLIILGEGNKRSELDGQIKSLQMDHRIVMPGRVGNVGDWYKIANLYVMSSKYEGFPNTLTEAMAHGLAPISFDCDTGPRDIVRHGIDGFLVDPNAGVEGMANAITEMISNETQRHAMAEAATDVRERFSMQRVAQMWDQVLDLADDVAVGRIVDV